MQLHSKTRFIAAQFSAVLKDGLWLKTAAHANRMAQKLAKEAALIPGVKITQEVQGNEVFAIIPRNKIEVLQKSAFSTYGMKMRQKYAGCALLIQRKTTSSNLLICCGRN